MKTLVQHFGGSQTTPRIAQSGVSYRSLCETCNRDVLGRECDPELAALSARVGGLVSSLVLLPDPIRLETKPHRIARAVCGHLLAAYVPHRTEPEEGPAPFVDAMRSYVLDSRAALPHGLEIYYWPYPSDVISVILGSALMEIRGRRASAPIIGHFLKFFPIAYWVVWERPPSARISMRRLEFPRETDLDATGEISLTKRGAPPHDWPERPGSTHAFMFDNRHTNISTARDGARRAR